MIIEELTLRAVDVLDAAGYAAWEPGRLDGFVLAPRSDGLLTVYWRPADPTDMTVSAAMDRAYRVALEADGLPTWPSSSQ
jgi:hypothetical protein